MHVEDATGKLRVPVRHQLAVTQVMVGHLHLVVAVRIRAGEPFLEVGEARVHRVAHQVQDARVRHGLRDEPERQEIRRQLVGERGAVARAPLRVGEVLASQVADVRARGGLRKRQVEHRRARQVAAPAELADQIVQLAGIGDIRMPAEDALQQGGARTRLADDEDRARSFEADPPRAAATAPTTGVRTALHPGARRTRLPNVAGASRFRARARRRRCGPGDPVRRTARSAGSPRRACRRYCARWQPAGVRCAHRHRPVRDAGARCRAGPLHRSANAQGIASHAASAACIVAHVHPVQRDQVMQQRRVEPEIAGALQQRQRIVGQIGVGQHLAEVRQRAGIRGLPIAGSVAQRRMASVSPSDARSLASISSTDASAGRRENAASAWATASRSRLSRLASKDRRRCASTANAGSSTNDA